VTVHCHRCGRATTEERIGVRAVCACGAFLHACLNCEFHAAGLANDCREPNAARVADKEQGNFCEWFRPGPPRAPATGGAAGAARASLDALFRKK
jgi:hypothetical protein